jgi:hypothetical protein
VQLYPEAPSRSQPVKDLLDDGSFERGHSGLEVVYVDLLHVIVVSRLCGFLLIFLVAVGCLVGILPKGSRYLRLDLLVVLIILERRSDDQSLLDDGLDRNLSRRFRNLDPEVLEEVTQIPQGLLLEAGDVYLSGDAIVSRQFRYLEVGSSFLVLSSQPATFRR